MTLENGTLLHSAARSIHYRQAPALPKSISVVLKSLRERLQPHLVSEEGKSAWHHDDSSEKDTRKKKIYGLNTLWETGSFYRDVSAKKVTTTMGISTAAREITPNSLHWYWISDKVISQRRHEAAHFPTP